MIVKRAHSFVNFIYGFPFSGVDEECSSNYSEREACTIRKSKSGSVSSLPSYFLGPHNSKSLYYIKDQKKFRPILEIYLFFFLFLFFPFLFFCFLLISDV